MTFFLYTNICNAEADKLKSPSKVPDTKLKFSNYHHFRQYLQDHIAQAKQLVWVASSSLTDGELTTSLSLAKYRKLHTAVLLEEKHLGHFSSQFPWLKAYQLSVASTAPAFFQHSPTYVLIDNKVAAISVALDDAAAGKNGITVSLLNSTTAAKDFVRVFKSQFLASYKRINEREFNLSYFQRVLNPQGPTSGPAWDGFAAFSYGRKADGKPHDIAKQLPKMTKSQAKSHAKLEESQNAKH